jgi:aarF domain-containing kinase
MAHRFARAASFTRHATLVRNCALVGTFGVLSGKSSRCDFTPVPVLVPKVAAPKIIASSAVVAMNDDEEERGIIRRAADKVASFFKYLYRFLTISAVATPLTALGPAAYILGGQIPILEDAAFSYLVWALEKLGPAFVKLGQWASTRPDLYPPRVIAKLTALQDNVTSDVSISEVENTLTDSFGEDWKDKLVLDPKPIGAGCIAQVYKGVYVDNGIKQDVAVKVIHPHVEEMLKTDMELLAMLTSWLDKIPSLTNLSLGDSAKSFCTSMTDQIDMKLEASNLILFKRNWQREDWAIFPEPIKGMVTKNVLVETLMEGVGIEKFMNMPHEVDGVVDEKLKKLKSKLSDMGARSMIKMIFFDNFIHGDLHPGNVLVTFDKKTNEPKLIFLDCGIVFCNPDKETHNAVIEICISFMQHDGRRAAKLMMDHSKNTSNLKVTAADVEAFIEGVHQIVVDSEEHNYFEHIGEYVMRICNLARDYHVKLDPGYFRIAMALKVAEGISLALDKKLDMISKCLPVIVKAKAYQALGIEDFTMSQVAEDLEQTKKELEKQEADIRREVKAKKAHADIAIRQHISEKNGNNNN